MTTSYFLYTDTPDNPHEFFRSFVDFETAIKAARNLYQSSVDWFIYRGSISGRAICIAQSIPVNSK